MKNITTHTGPFEILTRLPSSYYGNPRFLIRIDGFTCKTTVDSAHWYEVQNIQNGDIVTAQIGTHYGSQQLDALWIK